MAFPSRRFPFPSRRPRLLSTASTSGRPNTAPAPSRSGSLRTVARSAWHLGGLGAKPRSGGKPPVRRSGLCPDRIALRPGPDDVHLREDEVVGRAGGGLAHVEGHR